jgi:chromosome segregation protein
MNDLPQVANGASWRCIDFHMHTPGIHTFRLGDGDSPHTDAGRDALVGQYVDALAEAAINIAVITDYQGVRERWFTPIRDAAKDRGIAVLPGAELSLGQGAGKGVHLLLVCDASVEPSQLNRVIAHQHKTARPLFEERQQHQDLELRGSLSDCLRSIRDELHCVVIAAHANSTNGLLKVLGPKHTAELVQDGLIDAFEKCDDIGTHLQGTSVLSSDRLASLACILGSDPKSIADITSQASRSHRTWVKLSAIDAGALRLALHDPSTRVLTTAPPRPHHSRFLSMEVEGGFLGGLKVRFNDDLTVLIGGRGAGKSAILESLRYALDMKPYAEPVERNSLVTHALGSGGLVRILLERPGQQPQRYEVTRVLGQQPRVVDLATQRAVNVTPGELFGAGGAPMILLQREIQAVARDDSFRRRLLDEIIGEDARSADDKVQRTVELVRRNARALDEVEKQLSERTNYEERLNRLRNEIDFYEQQGVAAKLERHSSVGADGARVESARRQVADASASLTEARDALLGQLVDARTALQGGTSEHASELLALDRAIGQAETALRRALDAARSTLDALVRQATALSDGWPAKLEPLAADLRRLQEELKATTLEPQTYINAVQERTALEPLVSALQTKDKQREELLSNRADLLRDLQADRREAFRLRSRAAEQVNSLLAGKLRLEVSYLQDTGDFRQRLTALLKGSRVTAEAIEAVTRKNALDGVELARYVESGPATIVEELKITSANAERLAQWFQEPARIRQLQLLAPQDHVSIALFLDSGARDLAVLSGGQKATALLLLLFALGGRPLVLDQPEDDLDNRFVYEDVVTLLRAEKGTAEPTRRRQIIAATHNANIPVNGDAELVLSLEDVEGRCHVRARASIDDASVRDEIRTVLEGGKEAFRRRAEKYGGLDDAR